MKILLFKYISLTMVCCSILLTPQYVLAAVATSGGHTITAYQRCYSDQKGYFLSPYQHTLLYVDVYSDHFNPLKVFTDDNGQFTLSDKYLSSQIRVYLTYHNSILPGCTTSQMLPAVVNQVILQGIDCPAANCEIHGQ